MNPNDPRHPWQRLAAAARAVPDRRDTAAPYGFSTRLAALAAERKAVSLVERFALRAVGLACLLALLSVVSNLSVIKPATGFVEEELAEDDPVALLLSD